MEIFTLKIINLKKINVKLYNNPTPIMGSVYIGHTQFNRYCELLQEKPLDFESAKLIIVNKIYLDKFKINILILYILQNLILVI